MMPIERQVILVTGATDGHGKGVALDLVKQGATVLVHGHDDRRIADTLAELCAVGAAERCRGYRADLASLDEVRALAAQVIENVPRLDALVNDAGIRTRWSRACEPPRPMNGRRELVLCRACASGVAGWSDL